MEKFPYSYGSLDITKYPGAQYMNITFPDGSVRPCIVLPSSDKWMRLYSDKNGAAHAEININIDDASGLNKWAAEDAAKKGRQHTDFHGQIHLVPNKEGRAAWSDMLTKKFEGMSDAEFNAEAEKLKLDYASISSSDYYRQHPDKIPTKEQITARLVQNEIQRATSAGRIYTPELNNNAPLPTSQAVASPAVPNISTVNAAPQGMKAPWEEDASGYGDISLPF